MPHGCSVFADSRHRMRPRYVTQDIILAFDKGDVTFPMRNPIPGCNTGSSPVGSAMKSGSYCRIAEFVTDSVRRVAESRHARQENLPCLRMRGAMDERIPFLSTCPECRHKMPVDGYRRNELIKLLKANGEIKGYCINCDVQWPISAGERAGLARALIG